MTSSFFVSPKPIVRPAAPGWRVIGFILAIHPGAALIAGAVHLTEDEAYYRLWAALLQFGYYDHPPMIAWWIRAGTALVGDNALGVRLLPVLSGALVSLVMFDLAQRLGASARTARRATSGTTPP